MTICDLSKKRRPFCQNVRLFNLTETISERVLPVRDADSEGFLYLGLVENGIMRAGCLDRVVSGAAWQYLTEASAQVAYFPCQVVP